MDLDKNVAITPRPIVLNVKDEESVIAIVNVETAERADESDDVMELKVENVEEDAPDWFVQLPAQQIQREYMCSKSFTSWGHPCNVCGQRLCKIFEHKKRHKEMNKQQQQHPHVNKYRCVFCGKAFEKLEHMNYHAKLCELNKLETRPSSTDMMDIIMDKNVAIAPNIAISIAPVVVTTPTIQFVHVVRPIFVKVKDAESAKAGVAVETAEPVDESDDVNINMEVENVDHDDLDFSVISPENTEIPENIQLVNDAESVEARVKVETAERADESDESHLLTIENVEDTDCFVQKIYQEYICTQLYRNGKPCGKIYDSQRELDRHMRLSKHIIPTTIRPSHKRLPYSGILPSLPTTEASEKRKKQLEKHGNLCIDAVF